MSKSSHPSFQKAIEQNASINHAFTKQSTHYDEDDRSNEILQIWRQRVYRQTGQFLEKNSFILEINAGTGIDAVHFASRGHRVVATDLSDGMVDQIHQKIKKYKLQNSLSCVQCAFQDLDKLRIKNLDFIYSNFGGLNCADKLSGVTKHFPGILKPGGHTTLVIMPSLCPWEWLWCLKGDFRRSFRRFSSRGTIARLEGERFRTYYFSLSQLKKALGPRFKLKYCESLGLLSPPPGSINFYRRYPQFNKILSTLDNSLSGVFPFHQWGDHIIATFQFQPK